MNPSRLTDIDLYFLFSIVKIVSFAFNFQLKCGCAVPIDVEG